MIGVLDEKVKSRFVLACGMAVARNPLCFLACLTTDNWRQTFMEVRMTLLMPLVTFLTLVLTLSTPLFSLAQSGDDRARALGESLTANPDWKYPIIDAALTCEQANRISHRAVERLGYTVASFTPATAEKVGELKGIRDGLWGEKEPVTVKLTCPADGPRIDARPDIPPCEQGNRISRLAIERQGYKVTEFTPAGLGKAGIVKGEKQDEKPLVITLFCSRNNGVVMETSSESPLLKKEDFYLAISDFERGFYAMFKGERSLVVKEQTAVVSNQLQVTMKPLSAVESKIIFGMDVTTVLPVQIEITNPTARSYQVEADQIALLSTSGQRVKPLGEKGGPFPAPALTSQMVAPKSGVKGYLYFPPGTYTGGRGSLVEKESQESEGFAVQF
jgi:hypothetical protein